MKITFNYTKLSFALFTILGLGLLGSCSDPDDFKKYTEGGEIMYTGKLNDVEVYSGKGRVKLTGDFSADPKIRLVKIFWNDFADSVVYHIDKGSGSMPFEEIFEVDEGVKSFVIYTYDGVGNRSVAVNAVGTSYGDAYRRKLSNRIITTYATAPTAATISWESMDLSTGAQYTEVEYVAGDETKIVQTPVTEASTLLEGLTTSQTIRYRTIFKPDAKSIDTFAVAFKDHRIKVVPQLKNRQAPFIAASQVGRWGTLADWITNDAVKNQPGGQGGWDEWNGNLFNVESGWGAPGITNGKIYQTLELDPGTYVFEISEKHEANFSSLDDWDQVYLVVAQGETIPDVEQLSTALGYTKILATKGLDELRVEFTITEAMSVSMGYLVTQDEHGNYANIRAFNFYAK